MPVQQFAVGDQFPGFNPEQGLSKFNNFVCPICSSEVNFPSQSLALGASARWKNEPQKSKLSATAAPKFENAVKTFLGTDKGRFVLDFHCPNCHTPFAIGFNWSEFHMGDARYFPLAIWGGSE